MGNRRRANLYRAGATVYREIIVAEDKLKSNFSIQRFQSDYLKIIKASGFHRPAPLLFFSEEFELFLLHVGVWRGNVAARAERDACESRLTALQIPSAR